MPWIATLVKHLGRFLARFGVCGNAGLIVGAIAGTLLQILDLAEGGGLRPSPRELSWLWLILTALGVIVLLFVFVVFVRSRASSVLLPAIVNSALVVALTLWLGHRFDLYHLGCWVGILSGLLIGYVLCTLYKRIVE